MTAGTVIIQTEHPENSDSPHHQPATFSFQIETYFDQVFFYEGPLFPGAQGGYIKSVSC